MCTSRQCQRTRMHCQSQAAAWCGTHSRQLQPSCGVAGFVEASGASVLGSVCCLQAGCGWLLEAGEALCWVAALANAEACSEQQQAAGHRMTAGGASARQGRQLQCWAHLCGAMQARCWRPAPLDADEAQVGTSSKGLLHRPRMRSLRARLGRAGLCLSR